jgi:DNA-3-methyladenine glycosylase
MKLTRDFFAQPTLQVAEGLIGKVLTFKKSEFIITETEAYIGQDDPACHAARGKTPRNAVMFGHPGVAYVYFIYGMYYCLNFVTEPENFAAAVLIRGIRDVNDRSKDKLLNGPGKLCKYLNITRQEHNGHDIITSEEFFVSDHGIILPYASTPRIGISKGVDKNWRFIEMK